MHGVHVAYLIISLGVMGLIKALGLVRRYLKQKKLKPPICANVKLPITLGCVMARIIVYKIDM